MVVDRGTRGRIDANPLPLNQVTRRTIDVSRRRRVDGNEQIGESTCALL